jgi:hypothetical protein
MTQKISTLLEELEFTLNVNSDHVFEDSLPWASGAVAVKKALDSRYASRNAASSVIARMGGIKDPLKKKIRDQVLSLYRQEGATLKQMERDKKKKRGKTKPSTSKVSLSTKASSGPLRQSKETRPQLRHLLIKRPVSPLSNQEKEEVITSGKEMIPDVDKRVESFAERHPILTKTLKGSVIGGVVGLAAFGAAAALGGPAAILPAVLAKSYLAWGLANPAVGGALGAWVGQSVGRQQGVEEYLEKNVNKEGTFANRHPVLTSVFTRI